MENLHLTENGIPTIANLIITGQMNTNGIIVQVSLVAPQISNNKKMYKSSINDMKYRMNAVFIHNENQDLSNDDIVRIDAIFCKQGTSMLLVVKKYEILASPMQPLAQGPLEVYTSEMANHQANINNNHNDNININNFNQNNNNNNNRNFNQNQFDQGNSYQQNQYNNNLNYNNNNNNNYNNNNNRSGGFGNANRSHNYLPLSAVSTFTKEILMKVRVTKKFEKRTYGSGQKQGSVFSFNVIDEEGTEFPCCGFNKACEAFYDKITEGKVYEISGGYVKINDKKYTSIKSEYKYFLDERAIITELEDDENISSVNFSFKKLEKLAEMPQYSLVDVLAYVLKANELRQIKTKKGDDRDMRKVMLADDSGFKIEATIWGKLCHFDLAEGRVYAFKNLKLGEYNKIKNLTIGDDSDILEQDNKEAMDMQLFCGQQKEFRDVSIGLGDESNSMAGYIPQNLRYIKDLIEMLDSVDDEHAKLKSFKVKAVISGLTLNNEKFYYEGCPGCKKKLLPDSNNKYYCHGCVKNYDKSMLYYTLNFRIKDITGEIYVDVLGTMGQKVFGKTAEEIKELIEQKNDEEVKRIISQSDYAQFYFVIAPKLHTYNDIRRKKFSVLRIDPVEAVVETNRLISEMSKFL